MHFWKKYKLLPGIVFCLFLAMMAFFPRIRSLSYAQGLVSASISFLSSFIYWLYIQWLLHALFIKSDILKALIAAFSGMVLSFLIYKIATGFYQIELVSAANYVTERRKVVFMLLRGLVFSTFIFSMAYILHSTEAKHKLKATIERSQKEQLEARLLALQQQLHPHFLFNALNTLHSLTFEVHTRTFIIELSKIYRYLLDSNKHLLVTLDQELDFMKAYIYILKERFGNGFHIDVKIDPAYKHYLLPPLCMQLLVENAFKHNRVQVSNPLQITIQSVTDQTEYLNVTNRIQSRPSPRPSTGLGLQNIRERYALLSGKNISITQTAEYFSVSIPLLKNEDLNY